MSPPVDGARAAPAAGPPTPSRESAEFAAEVRRMFDRIAGVYDLMNTAMTAGMHHRWRARAADRAELSQGDTALDVCCGTGDLALELRRRCRRPGSGGRLRLLGANAGAGAEQGRRARGAGRLVRVGRRARAPLRGRLVRRRHAWASGCATSPTSSTGVAEMARVLKPGGRLVILEITQPRRPPLSCVPRRCGSTASSRCSARWRAIERRYSYLPESVKRFPPPERLAAMMDGAGSRANPLDVARGGHHRDPQRRARRIGLAVPRPSTVPPPVTSVLEAAGAWLPARMEAVERRLGEITVGHGAALAADAGATLAAGGKRLRPMLVLLCAGPAGGDRAIRAATADRARPHGDAGPRRRARRGAAAPRAPDGRGALRP